MYLAERNFEARSENKLRKNLFINTAYLGEKLEPFIYVFFVPFNLPGHDFFSMLTEYETAKIKVTRSNYVVAETVSVLSGLVNSGIELFLADKFKRATFKRIILPDVFVYSTSYGLSYKFVTGFKFREMSLVRLGWEHVMHGKNKNEFSLGLFHRFDHELKPEASVTISFGCEGVNLESSFAISLLEKLRLSAGVVVCASRSLFGERHATTHILNLKKMVRDMDNHQEDYFKNKYSANFWTGISFCF
ncbi:MAG: hypothetical protein LBD32_02680 [Cytophagales bacterium]|jgi:hypothetical protein|nr:hypothetical protein [Cytophagales bacterium]